MALQLKISIPAKDLTKQFRFSQDMSISEVCAEIREKTGEGGSDHGLFFPPDDSIQRKGQWLLPQKTLLYYGLKTGDLLVYKKKHRMLKIKLVDDTTKKILVDDSLTVSELTAIVGEHLGLKNVEEYSLKAEGQTGWLHPGKSLPEQNIDENTAVELRKKFFSSDANVEKNDALQVHFLYIQARDLVVSGQLPTQYVEACVLAGLQLQIEYGNFVQETHRYGWFTERLEQAVHVSHHKKKENLIRDVLSEWRKVAGMNPTNGKYRYVQMVRSLKTYGITCYQVEERTPKGPRTILLGIAAEKIYRMDAQTKEVYLQHPITHLRRYAATHNSITLDFADYETEYMTFRTKQAEEILQLISGYIDIFMKKKKSTGVVVQNDESETAQITEVAPVIGVSSQSYTSTIGLSTNPHPQGEQMQISHAGMASQYGSVRPLTYQQLQEREEKRKTIFGTQKEITEGGQDLLNEMNPFFDLLDEFSTPIGALGADYNPDDWRRRLEDSINSVGKTAEELRLMAKHPDRTAVAERQGRLLADLAGLIDAAKYAAANGGEEDISLLEGARKLATALTRMLHCSKLYGPDDPRTLEALAVLKQAQDALGMALKGSMLTDSASEALVMALAQSVNEAGRRVAELSASIARTAVKDEGAKAELLAAADAVEHSAQHAFRATDAAARALLAPGVKDMLSKTLSVLSTKNSNVTSIVTKHAPDNDARKGLVAAAEHLKQMTENLMKAVNCASPLDLEDLVALNAQLQEGVKMIQGSSANKELMIQGNRNVSLPAERIIKFVTAQLGSMDQRRQARVQVQINSLQSNLKVLTEATKVAVNNIADGEAWNNMVSAAERVRESARDILEGDAGKSAAIRNLHNAAKIAIAAAVKLVSTSRAMAPSMVDKKTAHDVSSKADKVSSAMPKLMEAMASAGKTPNDVAAQFAFINVARAASLDTSNLISSAIASIPRIPDVADKRAMHTTANEAYDKLQAMLQQCNRLGEYMGIGELNRAVEKSTEAATALDALLRSAEAGLLPSNPSGNASEARANLAAAADLLRIACDKLAKAATKQPNKVQSAARHVGENIVKVAAASKEVAPLLTRHAQPVLVKSAKEVAELTKNHLNASKAAITNPAQHKQLEQAVKNVQQAIRALVDNARLAEASAKECDAVIKEVMSLKLDAPQATNSKDFSAVIEDLDAKAKAVSVGLGTVVAEAKADDEGLITAAKAFGHTWKAFSATTVEVVALAPPEFKADITTAMQAVAKDTVAVMTNAKNATNDPNFAKLDESLTNVNAALRRLLAAVYAASPGHQEFSRAFEAVTKAAELLAAGTSSSANENDAFKTFNEGARALNAAAGKAAATSDADETPVIAKNAANALNQLMRATADIASLCKDAERASALRSEGASLAQSTGNMIQALQAIAKKGFKDTAAQAQLSDATIHVTDALARLRSLLPGQRECDEAIVSIVSAIGQLDSAALATAGGTLPRPSGITLHQAEELVIKLLSQLSTSGDTVADTTVNQPSAMAPAVSSMGTQVAKFASAATDMAALSDPSVQQDRLKAGKEVSNQALRVVKLAKAYSNEHSYSLRNSLAEAAKKLRDDLAAMMNSLQAELKGLRVCDDALAAIQQAYALLEQPIEKSSASYQEVRNRVEAITRSLIQSTVSGLLQGAKNNDLEKVGTATMSVGENSLALVQNVKLAAAATADPAVQKKLITAAKTFSHNSANLVKNAKAYLEAPKNEQLRSNLSDSFQSLAASVQGLLAVVAEGAFGEQDCVKAIAEMARITNEMDEAILYASTGAFEVKLDEGKSIVDYHDAFMKATTALQELSMDLTAAARASIEQVGAVSRKISATMTEAVRDSKAVAYLLESSAGQQKLLADTKQVASALQKMLVESKDVHLNREEGSSPCKANIRADDAKRALKELVEFEQEESREQLQRVKAILSAIEAVNASLAELANPVNPGNVNALPEHIVQPARALQKALPLLDNVDPKARVKAIQDAASAIEALVINAKGALRLTSDPAVRRDLSTAVRLVGENTLGVFQAAATKVDPGEPSREVVSRLQDLVSAVRKLPGGEDLELEENDLEKLAEAELQAAAQAIADAASRLLQTRPPDPELTGIALQEAQISAAILDAARAIAKATAILVQAAAVSQKELIAQGRANKALNPYRKDPAWANGFISAAQTIAGTIEDLVSAANDVANKQKSEEHLVAAARAVSAATARFVYASKVKSDPSSPSTRRLEEAAKATAQATQQLVDAAKAAAQNAQSASVTSIDVMRMNANQVRKLEYEIQVEIATLEKQLTQARERLAAVRRSEYSASHGDGTGAPKSGSPVSTPGRQDSTATPLSSTPLNSPKPPMVPRGSRSRLEH